MFRNSNFLHIPHTIWDSYIYFGGFLYAPRTTYLTHYKWVEFTKYYTRYTKYGPQVTGHGRQAMSHES